MAVLVACGGEDRAGGIESAKTGTVHFALTAPESDLMASIVIREIFSGESYLLDCEQKPHDSPEGDPFCDELVVLPPGVYEVIVQSTDPNCSSELAWYKIVVQEGETVELPITIVCGSNNGGLDVVVDEEYQPSVTDVDFTFEISEEEANKYICIGPDQEDVVISVTVNDPDTECEDLEVGWTAVDEFGVDVTLALLGVLPDPECTFSVTLDAQYPTSGTYYITFEVQDPEGHYSSFTFPVHLMECEP